MNLLTKIKLNQQEHNQIDYNSKLLLLGSCFSENIGEKFDYYKFQNTINPFGILFHPKAVETLIENAIDQKEYTEKDIFFHNEQWHCFDAHSKLSNASEEDLLKDLNTAISLTNKQIAKSTHIIITFGTAWAYNNKDTNNTVANCHKVPQKQFDKILLSVEEITVSLQNIISKIKHVNAKASVIFTVSPVRHLKDGFVENTQSKAHLIAAIHQFLNQEATLDNRQSFYFPSYEIMLDELRDYRFYKEDMLHPNTVAVDYIWNAFQQVWISSEANKTMQEVAVIQKGVQHKPFHFQSEAHQQFLQQLKEKQKALHSKFPHIVF